MSKKIRVLGVWSVFGFLVLLGIWVFGAPKPKAPNIQLRASFRSLTNPELQGYDFYTDKIFNDALGSYVSTDNNSVSVWFTPDKGELFFKIEHHADRSVNVIFPFASAVCGYLPDTAGLYADLPDETVDFFRFKTYNSAAFAEPRINFLTMEPGVPQQVRLWTTICTVDRHYFLLNYNNPNLANITGVVQVTAYDDNNNGVLDRWELQPLEGTDGLVYVVKQEGNGAKQYHCDFGSHMMPFFLTLERLN